MNGRSAGVWRRLHQVLLERLHAEGDIDWSRASVDSASVSAKKGGLPPARTRRIGARRAPSATSSPIARGTPLGLVLTGANCHDSPLMAPTLEAIPPLRRRAAWTPAPAPPTSCTPTKPMMPRAGGRVPGAGDHAGGLPDAASREVTGSGVHRWVVERSHAWFNRARRLPVRYERRADIYRGLHILQASLITLNQIKRFC